MKKAAIIDGLAARTGMSRRDAVDAVDIFLDSIKQALKTEGKVSLIGFGAFFLKNKPARPGRNPRTGANLVVPAKQVATFKPGKAFREMIEQGPPGRADGLK